nr:hypothetical protein [uncultured Arsenicibacter sp.]
MENKPNEDEIRAKQAISPKGMSDRSAEGINGPAAQMDDVPEPEPDEFEEKYMDGDNPAADLPMKHPNRNLNKPDIDKPSYS